MKDEAKIKLGEIMPKGKPFPGSLSTEEQEQTIGRIRSSESKEQLSEICSSLTRVGISQVTERLGEDGDLELSVQLLSSRDRLSRELKYKLAIQLMALERHEEAHTRLTELLAEAPLRYSLRRLRAECYEKLGRHVEALNERILSKRDQLEARENDTRTVPRRVGVLPKPRLFQKKKSDTSLHHLYLLRASYQLRTHEVVNAQGSLELAEEWSDPSAESCFLSGEIAFAKGQYERAIERYKRALELYNQATGEQKNFNQDIALERLSEAIAQVQSET